MTRLPDRPHPDHLKKQAKELLALYRAGALEAISRFRDALPQARGRSDEAIVALRLRLADAQSCVAREYGFASWADLSHFVAARLARAADRVGQVRNLLGLIYAGDITGGTGNARPAVAARVLAETPGLTDGDPYLACAVGDETALARETARDPAWVNRPGGPLALPPLVAVAHSSLARLPAYRDRLRAAARFLLDAGADPNQSVANRWMASPEAPDADHPLSALYGAAGQNRDPEMTRLLLARGADPNDGESLYHSLENPDCTRLLLEAGAHVSGTNALYRALDMDSAEPLRLLLARGGDANARPHGAPGGAWGTPLLWAIRRRRSPAHIAALLAAGADPSATTSRGESATTLALKLGLPAIADMLSAAGGATATLSPSDAFVAAAARGDAEEARRLLSAHPDLVARLPEADQRLLPELAAEGADAGVRTMVRLGWPVATRGGDWAASALNHAVFRGDAALTRFLLEHGAQWTETHGFGDNAAGTLSWASCNAPVAGGDWAGSAEALMAHGMPGAEPDAEGSDLLVVGGVRRRFADDVADVLLAASTSPGGRVAGRSDGG